MNKAKQFVLLVVAAVSLIFTPCAANAFQLLECTATGGVEANTSLFNLDSQGDPDAPDACEFSNEPVVKHIFSQIICDFVAILNAVMDSMYCGIHYYMVDLVGIALTLYFTLYGAQILMGMAQLSTRDAIVRMLKLSFIYVFATKSAFGINYIFSFFMGFITDASVAVISALENAQSMDGTPLENIWTQADGVCTSVPLDGNDIMTLYSFLDYLVCHAFLGPGSQVSVKVLGLFMAMIAAMTPLTLLFNWWLMTTFWAVLRTVVGFMKCLAAIAFLVTLSPIFISFFLFTATTYLFENWLRYLISFSVQIVMVFAILVFWILAIYQFVGFFNELGAMVFSYELPTFYGIDYNTKPVWSICPPVIWEDPATGELKAKCDVGSGGGTFDATPPLCDFSIACDPYDDTLDCGDLANYCIMPDNLNWSKDQFLLITPEHMTDQPEFLYYVVFHLVTLLLITYAFSVLLEKADDIARSLAGPSGSASLWPGFGGDAIGNVNNFKAPPGMKSRADGESGKNLAKDFHKLVGNR